MGSSGSNGVVERAVQEVEGDMRALLLGLESRVGFQIDARRPILTFLPAWGCYLGNRLLVGKDWKTAERVKGKGGTVLGLEFGEKVLCKKKLKKIGASLGEKLRPRWSNGIFLGVSNRSAEIWVSTKKASIVKSRTVRRIQEAVS